jgi:hypothetical protein
VKTLNHVTTRRDRCYLFGRRAKKLTPAQAAEAWMIMADLVERMGEQDVPKFNNILTAVRVATVSARRTQLCPDCCHLLDVIRELPPRG